MKIKMIVCSVVAASLMVGCVSEKENHHDKQAKQAKLLADAKISKDDAQKTALAKVRNGTIKEGELEKEDGKLIWSFDIKTPDSKDIKEVNVNAVTGDVVGDVETETPSAQSKEDKD
ncbi:MAG TPA: PepSY domain-containing protein [Verrucomicrobiae bacterium]